MALTDDKILEEWVQFIEGVQGYQKTFFEHVEEEIMKFNAPEIQWKVQAMQTQGAFFRAGGILNFVTFRHARMADFLVHATCLDFGDNTIAAWFLTCEPTFLKRWASKKYTKAMGYDATHPDAVRVFSANLSISNRLQLRAFVTAVHNSVDRTLRSILEQAGKDPSILDKNFKGKGFLEVW